MSRASASARRRGAGAAGEGSGSLNKKGQAGRPPTLQSGDLKALEDIGEDVLKELGRRLKSEEEASKLPATALMAVAQKYLSYLDYKTRILQEAKSKGKEMSVLELISQPELDPERKREILGEYIGSLEEDLASARKAMEEIDGEV